MLIPNNISEGVCIGALSRWELDGICLVARYFAYEIPNITTKGIMMLTPFSQYCFVSPEDVRG